MSANEQVAVATGVNIEVGSDTKKMERGDALLLFRANGTVEVAVSGAEPEEDTDILPPRVLAIVLSDIVSRKDGIWPQLWDAAFKATTLRLMMEKGLNESSVGGD